jgi:tRNA1(Val) A37 N6-methylase TrmN6
MRYTERVALCCEEIINIYKTAGDTTSVSRRLNIKEISKTAQKYKLRAKTIKRIMNREGL